MWSIPANLGERDEVTTARVSLFARARALLARPREEWAQIAADVGSPLVYVVALASIAPFASLIAATTHGAVGENGFAFELTRAGLNWFLAIAVTVGFAALTLPLTRSWQRALALSAYGATAFFVAGIFGVSPTLAFFSIIGFYSLWLFYLGARIALALSVPVALGIALLAGLTGWFAPPLVDRLAIDMAHSIGFAREAQPRDPVRQSVPSGSAAVDPSRLRLLLPERIGAYARREQNLELPPFANGVEGLYESDGRIFALRIADMADLGGALATLPDDWDETTGRGQASQLVGRRFLVVAAGQAAHLDELRAAVAAVDPDDLADLAE